MVLTNNDMNERTGFLSEQDLAAVQVLHKNAPYVITGISQGMFSVARYYGAMTYQGHHYTYIPQHDECVRNDVLRFVAKLHKAERKAERETSRAKQLEL